MPENTPTPIEDDYWATDDELPEGIENAAVAEWWAQQPESHQAGGQR